MNLDHFALSHICDNCPERVKVQRAHARTFMYITSYVKALVDAGSRLFQYHF